MLPTDVVNLKKSTLQWSLAHHERFGDTDIFPRPFEYASIRDQWSILLPELEAANIVKWQTSAFRRALTPKSRFGFRTATQLAPLDSIVFLGLVYEIAKDLESTRDPSGSLRVFSHRVKRSADDGQLYDPTWNFDRFKEQMKFSCNGNYQGGWVVSTDVADFYSRIYHHPLENQLRAATEMQSHVDAIMHLLSQWNFTVSSGLPVGPAASRILAEMALVDVDRTLSDQGIDYCRFSDDFRLFARSEREAHERLAILATALGESHLTLSERKTDIVTTERYVARHLDGERPGDAPSLAGQVASILEKYGYENDVYSETELEELPEQMVEELDDLDLNAILREQSSDSRSYDVFIVSLALRRLAQIHDDALVELVVDNLSKFTPVFPQTINYFERVVPSERRRDLGTRLLQSAVEGASGHREYQLAWLLDLFTADAAWATADDLQKLLSSTTSVVVRPKLIEALGVRGQVHWFRQQRTQVLTLNAWEMRAFIKGAASSLRADEYVPWIKSLRPRLDSLGRAVAAKVKVGP